MGRRRPVGGVRTSACIVVALLAACSAGDSTPRNLLLITVDTLRADHLSSYGYRLATSPNLDALARRGVTFENAFVQRAGTWPSLTSIFTSAYPGTHGVRSNGDMLAEGVPTLTQALSRNGFETLAVLTNMVRGRHPGFDQIIGFEGRDQGHRDERAVSHAVDWLAQRGDERFFLWLHLMGPHDPYEPAAPYRARFDTGYRGPLTGAQHALKLIHEKRQPLTKAEIAHVHSLYDAEIAEVDDRIARVLRALEDRGLADDTLVAFTSDHGEELYGRYAYFFHSWSIYDSVLRVPLILALPGTLPENVRLDAVVESIDLAPTLLDVLGVTPDAAFEGRSLLPQLLGSTDAETPAGESFAELGPYIQSIRTERWHYVYNPHELSSPRARDGDSGRRGVFDIAREELYDIRADPEQKRNVVAEHPAVAAELREAVLRFRASAGDDYRAQELSPALREELEALGYLD